MSGFTASTASSFLALTFLPMTGVVELATPEAPAFAKKLGSSSRPSWIRLVDRVGWISISRTSTTTSFSALSTTVLVFGGGSSVGGGRSAGAVGGDGIQRLHLNLGELVVSSDLLETVEIRVLLFHEQIQQFSVTASDQISHDHELVNG